VDRLKLPPLVTLLAAMHGGGGLCLVREWQRLYDSIAFESCLSFAQGDRRTVSLCVCCILRFPADSVFCSGIPRCLSLSSLSSLSLSLHKAIGGPSPMTLRFSNFLWAMHFLAWYTRTSWRVRPQVHCVKPCFGATEGA